MMHASVLVHKLRRCVAAAAHVLGVLVLACCCSCSNEQVVSSPEKNPASRPSADAQFGMDRSKHVSDVEVVDSYGQRVGRSVAWVIEQRRANWRVLDEMRLTEDPIPLAKAHGTRIEFEGSVRIEGHDDVGAIAIECGDETGVQMDGWRTPFRLSRIVAEVLVEAPNWDPAAMPLRIQLVDSNGYLVGHPVAVTPGVVTPIRLHNPTRVPVECRTCWPWVAASTKLESRTGKVPLAKISLPIGTVASVELSGHPTPSGTVNRYALVLASRQAILRVDTNAVRRIENTSFTELASRFDLVPFESRGDWLVQSGVPMVPIDFRGQWTWGFVRGDMATLCGIEDRDDIQCVFIGGNKDGMVHAEAELGPTKDGSPIRKSVRVVAEEVLELRMPGVGGKPARCGKVQIGYGYQREDRTNWLWTDSEGWVRAARYLFAPSEEEDKSDLFITVNDSSGSHVARISHVRSQQLADLSGGQLAAQITEACLVGNQFICSGAFLQPNGDPLKGYVMLEDADVQRWTGPFDLRQTLFDGRFRFQITSQGEIPTSVGVYASIARPGIADDADPNEARSRISVTVTHGQHLITRLGVQALEPASSGDKGTEKRSK